jgi:hypothetical protein
MIHNNPPHVLVFVVFVFVVTAAAAPTAVSV